MRHLPSHGHVTDLGMACFRCGISGKTPHANALGVFKNSAGLGNCGDDGRESECALVGATFRITLHPGCR